MAPTETGRYRVYYPEQEAANLPAEVVVEEQYPAFGIVSASVAAADELRKRYPVEPVEEPSPPPVIRAMAGAAEAAAAPQRRPPYYQVIRFIAPVREEWLSLVDETGCKIVAPLGGQTFVVRCPNKKSLDRLNRLDALAFVRDYQPDIQLSPDIFASIVAPPAAGAAQPEVAPLKRSSTNVALPGLLVATYFDEEAQQRARRSLSRQKTRSLADAGPTSLVIDLSGTKDLQGDLQAIIRQPGLRSLQEKKLKRTFNSVARLIMADSVCTPLPNGLGLTGRGEIIAVADTGLDTGNPDNVHPDFRGRVRTVQSFPIVASANTLVNNPGADDGPADIYSGHGTHVCGSILGSGTRAAALGIPTIQGLAPEAELVFQAVEQTAQWKQEYIDAYIAQWGVPPKPGALLGIPDNVEELFQQAYDQNARIHSDSWGGGDPGEYDKQCQDLDRFIWQHRDFLVVVAAGNDGTDVNPKGSGIDLGSVTSPAVAKNCLTVGACENDRPEFKNEKYGTWWPGDFSRAPFKTDAMCDGPDDIVAFSSRGPCKSPVLGKEGRRKPDVIAPGTFILSTRSSQIPANNFAWGPFADAKQDYMFMGGTSMATPLVAGSAALVRQFLRESKGIADPSAALLKAVLIHSAHYIAYRHKRVDSAPWADNEQGWGRVNLKQVLKPEPPTQVLFMDASDGLTTGQAKEYLVDLADASVPLRVTLVYTDYPGKKLINNLHVTAFEPNGGRYYLGNDFANTGTPDSMNNVEGIRIENPAAGTWRIQVVGADVPHGPQDYALVVSGANAAIH